MKTYQLGLFFVWRVQEIVDVRGFWHPEPQEDTYATLPSLKKTGLDPGQISF
jgi:hypothetical protein